MTKRKTAKARTIYISNELWEKLESLSRELGVSVSKLISDFCLQGLKDGIPKDEYERLQKMKKIDENYKEMVKLTMWGNELRKSGAYAQMALNQMLKGEHDSNKKRVSLPSICSKDELEATVRLIQHRNKLAEETAKLIKEVYPDLGTFHVGADDKGIWKVYHGKEVTPNTIATSLMGTIDVYSQTPFEDWIKKQKGMLYDFRTFNGVADFYNQIEHKARGKSKKASSTATGTDKISHTSEA
jgi:predicted CopG family antitoxin